MSRWWTIAGLEGVKVVRVDQRTSKLRVGPLEFIVRSDTLREAGLRPGQDADDPGEALVTYMTTRLPRSMR